MLPNGELDVLSVRQGDKNHQYNCRVRPTGQDGGGATGDCGNRGPNVDLGGQEAVLLCVSYRWAAVLDGRDESSVHFIVQGDDSRPYFPVRSYRNKKICEYDTLHLPSDDGPIRRPMSD